MKLQTFSRQQHRELPAKSCQIGYCNRVGRFSDARIAIAPHCPGAVTGVCVSCNHLVCMQCAFPDRSACFRGIGFILLRCPRCGRLLGDGHWLNVFLSWSRDRGAMPAEFFESGEVPPDRLDEMVRHALRFGVTSREVFERATAARERGFNRNAALILLEEADSLKKLKCTAGLAWCLARVGVLLWEDGSTSPARQAFASARQLSDEAGELELLRFLSLVAAALRSTGQPPEAGRGGPPTEVSASDLQVSGLISRKEAATQDVRNLVGQLQSLVDGDSQSLPGTACWNDGVLASSRWVSPSRLDQAALRGAVYANLSLLQRKGGYVDDAIALKHRAVAIWRKDLGVSSLALCESLMSFGDVLAAYADSFAAHSLRQQARQILFGHIWSGPTTTIQGTNGA